MGFVDSERGLVMGRAAGGPDDDEAAIFATWGPCSLASEPALTSVCLALAVCLKVVVQPCSSIDL